MYDISILYTNQVVTKIVTSLSHYYSNKCRSSHRHKMYNIAHVSISLSPAECLPMGAHRFAIAVSMLTHVLYRVHNQI